MKVYVLGVGCYSDYRVVAVFDENHLEEAMQISEWIGGDIEEEDWFELNKFDCDEPPKGMKFLCLQMHKDGSLAIEVYEEPVLDDGYYSSERAKPREELYELKDYESCRIDYITDPGGYHKLPRKSHWRLFVQCYAESEKHAIKIANDIRARILAGALPKKGLLNLISQVER